MLTFKTFSSTILTESDDGKLKHIEHLEDHHINDGAEGFHHAVEVLHKVKGQAESTETSKDLTVKKDGSPSLTFGHHPETGKFFVATKSAFNKTPKLNYTEADIEANHGHAPGLVEKLKHALKHLPKVAPKTGVYQGDVMHSRGDVIHNHDGSASFTPNTITYTAKGKEAEKAKKAHFGLVVHTKYEGKDLQSMRAEPSSAAGFGKHPDVHLISHHLQASGKPLSSESNSAFHQHLADAQKAHGQIDHDKVGPMKDHLKVYINSTIRDGSTPSVEGFRKHVARKHDVAIDSVKTEKAKAGKQAKRDEDLKHIDDHSGSLEASLKVHQHLQAAKNILVDHMNRTHTGFDHHIRGKATNPEGYVASHKGQLSKFVNRREFSAANFATRG